MSRRTIWHGSLASLVAIRDSDLYARKLKPLARRKVELHFASGNCG